MIDKNHINHIIHEYFSRDNVLINHQIGSYDDLIDNILPEIINNRNKIDNVFCELHGSQERKNKFLNYEYLKIVKTLNDIDPDKKWFKYHH